MKIAILDDWFDTLKSLSCFCRGLQSGNIAT
jgi:hypothetical protein